MKKLVQLMMAVAAVGLLAVCVGQASRLPVKAASSRAYDCAQDARETGRQDACPTMAVRSCQEDQLAASLTCQFLNQLDACAIH